MKRRGNMGLAVLAVMLLLVLCGAMLKESADIKTQADKFMDKAFQSYTLESLADMLADDVKRELNSTSVTIPLSPFENEDSYVSDFKARAISEKRKSTEIAAFIKSAVMDEDIKTELLKASKNAEAEIVSVPLSTEPFTFEITIKARGITLEKTYLLPLEIRLEEEIITVKAGELTCENIQVS